MSSIDQTAESRANPAELGEALTYIRPNFTVEASDSFYVCDHPIANDAHLAETYGSAAELMPEPSEGKQGVVLIVGNGAFEMLGHYIPPEYAVLICDRSSTNLLTQRIVLESMRNALTAEEFLEAMEQFGEDYVGLQSKGVPEYTVSDAIGQRYRDQLHEWDNVIPYFLESEDAYSAARDALLQRAIGFRHIDLQSTDEMDTLAVDLNAQNAEVVLLNATNAFAVNWARPDSGAELTKRIPFNPDAVVMDSTGGALTSRAYRLGEWHADKEEAAKDFGVRRSASGEVIRGHTS